MKFKLPFQLADETVTGIISREIKKQKITVLRASRKQLKEIAEIAKQIQKAGLPEYLVCKKLPQKLGHGIFLHPRSKPLLKGRVIAPYSGVVSIDPQNAPDDSAYVFGLIADVYLTKDEQALLNKKLSYRAERLYSINLDALKNGNFTRFINHSDTPNVIAHLVRVPANDLGLAPSPLQIIYFAKKTIHPGEQLLVSYEEGEKSYWTSIGVKPVPITPKTFQLNRALKVVKSS
jgi:SET domain